MINEFKYGQTSKIWPSPLSLSLNSTFKIVQSKYRNAQCYGKVNDTLRDDFLAQVERVTLGLGVASFDIYHGPESSI